jgi:hypothetical protein
MKKILCGNTTCWQRRPHHESEEDTRPHQLVEVPYEYTGKVFCSITCACYAGYYSVTKGWIKDPKAD